MTEFSYPLRHDDSPSEAVLGSAARMNPSHVGADGDVDGSKRHATELMTSSSGDGEVGHLLEREVDVGRDASSEPEMVRVLEGTARFKVLRSVPDLQAVDLATISRDDLGIGVVIDLETTGLGVATAEIIELGMVKFAYDRRDARLVGIVDRFSGLRQPWSSIPAEVTKLTGIDDAMVAGHEIDGDDVVAFVRDVDVVVAHNARFDRPFAEARWPTFSRLPWACSCTGVEWRAEGFDGARLGHLLMQSGYFHAAHRAVDDALATLHLLALPLPTSGRSGLSALLERARVPTWRVWAEGSPFEAKDLLKKRGYRWSPGGGGLPKSWYRDLPEDGVDAEVSYLEHTVLGEGARPTVVPVSARDRFTNRAGATRPRSA